MLTYVSGVLLQDACVAPTYLDKNATSAIVSIRIMFSMSSGILLVATGSTAVYLAVTCNKPKEIPFAALGPSVLSGIMWNMGELGSTFASDGR